VKNKRWAFISLTVKGLEQCQMLRTSLDVDGDILCLAKRAGGKEDRTFDSFQEMMACAFSEYEVLVCVMASGIVVRALAPLMVSKISDPAVLVMDERARFCISLLSGHLGHANDCARLVEEKTGATAVITTASDVSGSLAVDTLAMRLGLSIDDMLQAKDVTAALVNGEKVLINQELADLPDNAQFGPLTELNDYTAMILINPFEMGISLSQIDEFRKYIPCVCLYSLETVIGLGCRKGVSKEKILKAIVANCEDCGLPRESIKRVVTVDVKQDEAGIIDATKELGAELLIIGREEISQVEDMFPGSEFVKETIGVRAVAEPCGYLGSDKGVQVCGRKKLDGVTVSIWRMKND
jgi:cobalt-precorrin 5A hydrolase